MCGISGFNWKDKDLITAMNTAINHRGPDDTGIYTDDHVSLGTVRLAIIDLSSAGKQPMSNEDETVWILHNGEVYNFLELRKVLEEKGYTFTSNTDTEVVLHAYQEWGPACVEQFNGMWAFALYDKNKNRVVLSRDRFGIKPLYWYYDNGAFIFSSEIKGILKHAVDRIPNDKIIYEYLAFGLVDHLRETFFKDIYRVMPGENVIFDISKKSLNFFKWYTLTPTKIEKSENIIKRIKSLFTSSVKYRLIADVPVGSCLSGGIDSSAIVCTMANLQHNSNIKTFSLVFPELTIDERPYIDEVVEKTQVEPHMITPTVKDVIDDLYDLVWTQEEPFGSLSIYGQYKVMELAHNNNMKVLLDGQGGDELFAGYHKYYRYYLAECLLHLQLKEALRVIKSKDAILFLGAVFLIKIGLTPLLTVLWSKRKQFIAPFYTESFFFRGGVNLTRVLHEDLLVYSIPQLLRYEDKNSMRWSIETRVPFLDHRFAAFVAFLPFHFKIREGITKYVFRKSIEDVIPLKIQQRRDKIGFATPDEKWFRTPEFRKVIKTIINSDTFKSRKYWNQKEVEKLVEEHLHEEKEHSRTIWKIINTELWLRIFIDENQIITQRDNKSS